MRTVKWGGVGFSLIGAFVGAPAFGWQDDDRPRGARDGVVDKDNAGDAAADRPARRDPVEAVKALRQFMIDQVKLSPEQEPVVKALFEAHLQKLEEAQKASGEPDPAAMAKLREEMRAATEAGDNDKARELRQKLRDLAGSANSVRRLNQEFVAEVRGKLNAEQQAEFDDEVRKIMPETRGRALLGAGSIAAALRRVQLDDQQKASVDALQEEYKTKFQQAPRGDREAMRALFEEFRGKVLALLDEQQKAQFRAAEESAAQGPLRPGGRGVRRGDRGADGAGQGQP